MKQEVTIITNEANGVNVSDWVISSALHGLDITQVMTLTEVQADVTAIQGDVVVYVPDTQAIASQMAIPVIPSHPFLMPWFPAYPLPSETAIESSFEVGAWVASTCLVQQALPKLDAPHWTLLSLAEVLEQANIYFQWGTVSALPNATSFHLNSADRSVLAVVPHYRCETWLSRCLRSLLTQTRPPDGIVVIDDASSHPPIEIVEQFPSVTLLAAPHRVGPYRLIQQVIDDTNYWGYLFQDADDWSSCDRLQHLLHLSLTTGAELVGTQEMRVYEDEARLTAVNYPLDVNAALATKPGHPLLHPTSLVTRDLVQRVGGFATGLRFGGDTEFLLRAVWVAQVLNLPSYSYFRRKRPHSLTTALETGLESPARRELLQQLKQRAMHRSFSQGAIAHQVAVASGAPLDLSPIATAPAISLKHITGSLLHN